jgi:putative hydrolase of the HAD superfamily
MIRAIFFDGGGVISHFDEELIGSFERERGLSDGDIVKALYSGREWIDAEMGVMDEDAWLKIGVRRLGGSAGPVTFSDLRDVWDRCFLKIDRQVLALAKALSSSYRIGLLTNSSSSQSRLEVKLARVDILDMWHIIINSAEEGIAKPDPRIYAIAAQRIGAEPSECVHIDDKLENVEGARAAGFRAVHHTGSYTELVRRLSDMGITNAFPEVTIIRVREQVT